MFRIRRFQAQDHEAVISLHHLGLDQYGANAGPGPWDDDLEDIPANYLRARGDFIVGTWDDRVVAMGALRRVSDDTAEIKRMRVHPDFQRRGLGNAILRELEHTADELGYSRAVLDTTVNQVPAQNFYQKHGYVVAGRDLSGPLGLIFFDKILRA
jgi:ribosomal protein S18 acetylase RimI-like enzyme